MFFFDFASRYPQTKPDLKPLAGPSLKPTVAPMISRAKAESININSPRIRGFNTTLRPEPNQRHRNFMAYSPGK